MNTKFTKKGNLILKTLQATKGFCTAQELHKKIPTIHLTTIYRNLEKFANRGVIQKIFLANQEYAYEYTKHKHHHTLCYSCNKVEHIHLDPHLFTKIPELTHFTKESVEITITGTCTHKQ